MLLNRWTKFGIFFTAVIILNQTVRRLLINRKNSSTSTVSSFITSTHTLLWCLSYFYVLPVYFLYPVSTHKFTNTFTIGASVISLNLACIALLLLELNKKHYSCKEKGERGSKSLIEKDSTPGKYCET
ncbi:hypothetical protein M8J75_013870 [Diaphorina citri]|nr:hypothetical protein M8J75_013870 [Diaphorina citri]